EGSAKVRDHFRLPNPAAKLIFSVFQTLPEQLPALPRNTVCVVWECKYLPFLFIGKNHNKENRKKLDGFSQCFNYQDFCFL
ncbi:hypothetical protein, partial [Algoriphagus winogradskyi]